MFDLKAGKSIAETSENLGRGHAERLMPMLEELLADAPHGWQDITRLGVVNGPGSFTGLRVGIATARGLALALGVSCNTISVFDSFEEEFGSEGGLGVVIDARRGQVWMQCFEKGEALALPLAVNVDDVGSAMPSSIRHLAGSAAPIVADMLNREVTIASDAASPAIAAVSRRIAGQSVAEEKPKALYLRAPDAKPQTLPVTKA